MNTTCGPLYQSQLSHYAGSDPAMVKVFAAGFVTGEAEKIYLGACSAAMFRPSFEFSAMLYEVVRQVAQTYGLSVDSIDEEIWLYHPSVDKAIATLGKLERQSEAWHFVRGVLTGVALRDIDFDFHLRKGFGERCDELHI